ncbi:MAG TPA: hypothetical protein VGJ09_10310 [Bryobacteraceae bacterium]|jgi:hypothetical protein
MRRTLAIAAFIVLLTPSVWFAWRNRAMPQLGEAHDDAIYHIVSKALAEGDGYRITSLPAAPFETKYPPLLIWMLALVWRINPRFPENLMLVTALQWAMIPPFLWLSLMWLKRAGLSSVQRWIGLTLLAIGPYTVLFGAGIFTEVLFTFLLLGSLLACEEARTRPAGWKWAAAAGFLAGLGFLTRTAGIAAIVAVPLVFVLWKKRWEAAAFLLAALPEAGGWTVWSKLHQTPATDLMTLYNTNYLRFELVNVHFSDLGVVVWKNVGDMLYAMGALAFSMELDSFGWQLVRMTVAAGIMRGLSRHWRNPVLQPYILIAILTTAELLVWHYPPNLRLMYPLLPLFMAGLIWEGGHFVDLIRKARAHRQSSQRAAAWVISGIGVVALVTAVWMQGYMLFRTLPDMVRDNERTLAEQTAVYDWIDRHAEPGAAILASNPSIYLYTGRRTASQTLLPIYWYRGDTAGAIAAFRDLPVYAAENRLAYLYIRDFEYGKTLGPEAAAAARRAVETNPALQMVVRFSDATLFQATSSLSSSSR